jgi:hypothetical protein
VRKAIACTLVGVCLVLSGCFDIEESLTLEKNLSGKAGLKIGLDFEPMIYIMAAMKRGFEGKEGPPTKEELAAAKQDFLTKKKSGESDAPDPKKIQEDAKKSLPPGIRLLDSSVEDLGLQMKMRFLFAFDDVSKLAQMKLSGASAEGGPPGVKNPVESPFDSLRVVDEGKTLLITSRPTNPLGGKEATAGESGGETESGKDSEPLEVDPQIREVFKNFRVAWRIEAPFAVVESNATRKEGNALIWEYRLEDLERMDKEARAKGGKSKGIDGLGVWVRYRK